MERRTRGIAAFAVALVALLAPSTASAAGEWDHLLAPESTCVGQTDRSLAPAAQAAAMVCMYQYARAQSGLPAFAATKKLRATALRKAKDIRRCEDFSHSACGRDAFYWQQRLGFLRGSAGVGENLALGSGAGGTVRAAMGGWLGSDGHRAVVLEPRFDQIGIGMVSGKFRGFPGTAVWVAHLGYRR